MIEQETMSREDVDTTIWALIGGFAILAERAADTLDAASIGRLMRVVDEMHGLAGRSGRRAEIAGLSSAMLHMIDVQGMREACLAQAHESAEPVP